MRLSLLVFGLLATSFAARAELLPKGPLFAPEGPGRGEYRIGVGAQMNLLPVELVESEQREIPEIATEFRYGLPYGLTADARFQGIVVKNAFDLGATWFVRVPGWNVDLGVGLRHGMRFGALSSSAFDSSSSGFVTRPSWSIGMPWRNVRFTFSQEYLFSHDQHLRLGDIQVTNPQTFRFEGTTSTISIESIFPGGGLLYLGIGLVWSSNYDQAWLAFSDQRNSRVFYPRFLAGYAF